MFKKIIFLIIILVGFSISLKAQEDTTSQNHHSRFNKAIKEKMMEKLNIDEATADKVIRISNEQKKTISGYVKEKKQITKYIEDNPDASDIMNKIDEFISIDDKINKAKKVFIDELKVILTPKQIAQALTFQKNLRKMFFKEKEHK